jgi:ribosomal protein S17
VAGRAADWVMQYLQIAVVEAGWLDLLSAVICLEPPWAGLGSHKNRTRLSGMSKFVGLVVSNKMQKSVTVKVDHYFRHPRYHKFVRSSRKFMAHDELEACAEGDQVEHRLCIYISCL